METEDPWIVWEVKAVCPPQPVFRSIENLSFTGPWGPYNAKSLEQQREGTTPSQLLPLGPFG